MPPKRGSRMAVAVDAMAEVGFDPELVRQTVKRLLQVYGVSGWTFIEADCYKELLEELLRDQTNGDENGEHVEVD